MAKKTIALLILDGWGIGRKDLSNPIHAANLVHLERIRTSYLSGALQSSGIAVGLPWGEEGDSEVGHLTLGAGKVIYQHYPRITLSIRNGDFFKNTTLLSAFRHAREHGSAVHLVGLLTEGNVHASLEHLRALLDLAARSNANEVNLHLFSDGKDSPPKSVRALLKKVESFIQEFRIGRIASIAGRFYGEDRDEHWQRTEKAFRALIGEGPLAKNVDEYIEGFFARGLTDEFIEPALLGPEPHPVRDGDAIIFFDFREDSIRQIAAAFIESEFTHFARTLPNNLFVATMTAYSKQFNVPVAYPPETIEHPLGKVLADNGRVQIRIAETQKYAHVTYFFNGYREEPYPNEYRVLVPSKTNLRPDEEPEMRTNEVAARTIESIEGGGFNLVVANFAAPDVVAHTGNYDAALAAVKAVDEAIGHIMKVALLHDALLLITSDHAHIETMINPLTGIAETGHHANLVPIYLVGRGCERPKSSEYADEIEKTAVGMLADVAPTILELMEITKPQEMSGQSLMGALE